MIFINYTVVSRMKKHQQKYLNLFLTYLTTIKKKRDVIISLCACQSHFSISLSDHLIQNPISQTGKLNLLFLSHCIPWLKLTGLQGLPLKRSLFLDGFAQILLLVLYRATLMLLATSSADFKHCPVNRPYWCSKRLCCCLHPLCSKNQSGLWKK